VVILAKDVPDYILNWHLRADGLYPGIHHFPDLSAAQMFSQGDFLTAGISGTAEEPANEGYP
jgi:hypothetical protein